MTKLKKIENIFIYFSSLDSTTPIGPLNLFNILFFNLSNKLITKTSTITHFLYFMPYIAMNVLFILTVSGIGIDDMFVVVQCWMNLQKSGNVEGMFFVTIYED
jgi:hypothetical protein